MRILLLSSHAIFKCENNEATIILSAQHKLSLTRNEASVLYGLTSYPTYTDSALADVLGLKLSTFTSIKRRLATHQLFRTLNIPLVNHLGCELLAVIHTQFNPVMPLEQRIQTTKNNIEVFDELFLSVGDQEKGFSLSLSENYTNIGRINEIRTELFGRIGLLDKKYPTEVIFPFQTSTIHRFFDYVRLLQQLFSLPPLPLPSTRPWFSGTEPVNLSPTEQQVFLTLVQYPTATTQDIGTMLAVSRHTVARMKNDFLTQRLLRPIVLPDLHRLGFELLTFTHLQFNPHKAPTDDDLAALDTPATIFLASRQFEAVRLAAYPAYQSHLEDDMTILRHLKENDLLASPPATGTYSYDRLALIKDFDFASLTRKILAASPAYQKENHQKKTKNT